MMDLHDDGRFTGRSPLSVMLPALQVKLQIMRFRVPVFNQNGAPN